MGKISLSNIIDELAAKSGITRESSANFMHAFIAAIERGLKEDNIVKIKGLGTFKLQEVNDRDSVDVNTGERITIKGYRKVTFTPDSVMKELVNRPFAHFEPTELNDGFPVDEVPVELDVAEAEAPEVEVVEEIVNPVTEEPVTEEPVAEESATEDSVVEEIVTGEPIAEEPIAEAPIAEDPTSEEPVADEPVADAQVTDEPVLESASMQAEPVATKHLEPKNEKRRRGCFWKLLLLLFVVAAALALVYGYITLDGTAVEQEDAVVENEAITVRSNLEEELGAEWSNAPQVEKHQQIEKEEVAVGSVKQSDIAAPIEQEAASAGKETPIIIESEVSKERPTEVVQPTKPDFCKVTPTEALQAKTVKDITLADTTDYAIDGTLVTHKLKSGETIIQLANKYYGDKRLWPYIVKHNRMSDFNRVAIGQRIDIPVLKDKSVK